LQQQFKLGIIIHSSLFRTTTQKKTERILSAKNNNNIAQIDEKP